MGLTLATALLEGAIGLTRMSDREILAYWARHHPEDTYDEAVKNGTPVPAILCAVCGDPYFAGCPRSHQHAGWLCLDGWSDIRRLWCGCYAHKECAKSGHPDRDTGGNWCATHGQQSNAGPLVASRPRKRRKPA